MLLQEELNHDEKFQEVLHLLPPSSARAPVISIHILKLCRQCCVHDYTKFLCIPLLQQFFSQMSSESDQSYFGDLFNESLDGRHRHKSGNATLTPSSTDTVRHRQPFAFTDRLTPRTVNSSYALKDLASAGEKAYIFEIRQSGKSHASERRPRGLGRMVSCPENVVIRPVDKAPGKSAGR